MAQQPLHLDCIIKFGGSAITCKQQFEVVDMQAINIAVDQIKRIKGSCLIVHGAGSFGHFQAKKYNIASGFKDNDLKQQRIGFSQTRLSVTKLNHIIVEALVEKGVPAVSISPCGLWKTTERSISSTFIQPINDLLKAGFIPVMHGDAVIDTSLGCTILSGDTIIKALAENLSPKRVIFLTDTDGIYDRPPHNLDASLLRYIRVTKDGKIADEIETSQLAHDVTGGVQIKIASAAAIVSKFNIPVHIVKIGSAAAWKILDMGELEDSDIATSVILAKSMTKK